jgi:DNA-binding phage protein
MNKIIKALREIIKKEKATIYSVAKAIDVDFSSLYRALKNGGNPGAKTTDKILDHLGYEIKLIKKSKKKGGEKR